MTQRKSLPNSQSASQRKRRSAPREEDDDDDLTFSQPNTSQSGHFTSSQVEQKVAEVVQYFLVKDQKKIPVRRADLVKTLLKEYRSVSAEIMKQAMLTLDQVFGLKVVEIDTKNHLYILINKLEPTEEAGPVSFPSDPKKGVLFVILSLIFMKGGVVKENLIWRTLKKLRVDSGEKHSLFGDVKRLVIDEFVRQRYLVYVRVPHTDPVVHEFRWGQRADLEVSKAKILQFMSQLYDQAPQTWKQQFREAHKVQTSEPSSSQR